MRFGLAEAVEKEASKEVVEELESAIYSDKESYTNNPFPIEYKDVLEYFNNPDNAEEGL